MRILILSFSPIARDPRVMRQIGLLASRARLTVAGYGAAPRADIDYVSLELPQVNRRILLRWEVQLLLGLSDSYYWSRSDTQQALKAFLGHEYDLLIANDISALPLALRIAGRSPVLVDAHEFSPGELSDSLMWRIRFGRHYESLCRRYLPHAAAMTTVCSGIEEEYRRRFGVAGTVIENAPLRQDLAPSPIRPGRIRLIHHGGASRARHLELMIDMMNLLDERFSLDFMLVPGDVEYLEELRLRCHGNPRISFVSPVDMPAICAKINEYDIGVYVLPPSNINHRFALPNKLFEFIQARLAVAIGPSLEMARVVQEHGLGVVADSFDPASLARKLNALSEEDVLRYKRASHAASGQLCFETAAGRLLALIEQLVSRSRDREQAFA